MRFVTRIGVVGLGPWGLNHFRTCQELGVLAGACDLDSARLAAASHLAPTVPLFLDFDALLATVDAIVIAAPAPLHARLASQCIAAKKPVLIEKPLALNVEDAEHIADEAERLQIIAGVGHVLLYHRAVQAMRAQIASGAIGRVKHVRARRLNLGRIRSAEDVWWSFSPHDIAVTLALFGGAPRTVVGALHATRGGPADFAYADLDFGDGRSGHIEASWLDPQRAARIDVFGSDGLLCFEDSSDGAELTLHPCGVVDGELATWRRPAETISFVPEPPLRVELEAFLDAIESGSPLVADTRHGVEVVRVLAQLQRSALSTGREAMAV